MRVFVAGSTGAIGRPLLEQLREEGRLLHKLSKATPGIVQALDVGAMTTPAGVWMASATQSGMLWVTRMNSTSNGPIVTRWRGRTAAWRS